MAEDVYKVVLDDSQLRRVAREVAREFDNMGGNAQKAGSRIDSSMTGAAGNVKKAFGDMTSSLLGGFKQIAAGAVGFTAVMEAGNFVRNMYQQVGEFNKSMQEVSTISQDVTNDMEGYKQQVMELTTQIPIGANGAAKALYQIISAGQQGADAMHVLEVSAKAAIGGVTETETAADTITTILNAYKLTAADAEKISDKLFTTVRLGKTTMSELGASIANVAPIAATYGVSIEEVLSAIATLTKQGTATAVATTQIRSAILATTNSLGDGAFKTRTFAQALDEVAKKAKGSETALKDDLGRVEAMNAVMALTGKNAQGAAEDLAAMQDSAGAAEEAFQKMAQTAGAQVELLQNHLVQLFSPVANALKGTTAEIARSLNMAFESGQIEEFGNLLKGLVITFGAYRAAVLLTTAAEAVRATGIGAMTAKEVIHYGWLVATEKAQKLLNATMLNNPYVLAATALGALVAIFISYNKELDEAKLLQGELDGISRRAQENMSDERTQLERLRNAAQDENLTMKERQTAIDKLNSVIPNYNAQLDATTGKYQENKAALDEYLKSLAKQYEIEGAKERLSEIGKKRADLEIEKQAIQEEIDATNRLISQQGKSNNIQTTGGAVMAANVAESATYSATLLGLENQLKKTNDELRVQDNLFNRITKTYETDLNKEAVQALTTPTTPTTPKPQGNGDGNDTLRQQQQIADQLLSLQRQNEQAQIDIMQDGMEKRERQRQLDLQKQLDAIEKQRQAWRQAQGGRLTQEQESALQLAEQAARRKQQQAEQADYRQMLESYRGYLQQRKALQEGYAKDRRELLAAGGGKAAQDELDYQEQEALKNLDLQFAQREASFRSWADSIADASLEKLNMMLMQAKIALEQMERQNPNNPALATARAKVTTLQKQIQESSKKTTSENGLSPNEKAVKKWKDLQRVLNDAAKGFEQLGEEIGGVAGEMISAAGSIAASTISIIDGITTLANSAATSTTSTAQAASAAISSVEKASVILTIISAALQIAQKIASLFAADMSSYNTMKDEYENLSEIWDELISKKKEYIGISYAPEARKAADEAEAIVKESVEAARRLALEYANAGAGAFSHSKGYLMNAAITAEEWDKASQSIGRQVRSVYDLINLTGEQLQMVKEASPYLWAHLQEDFRGYLQDIIESEQSLKDITDTINESLTTITFDDVKNNFFDTLMDMESSSADFADNVAEDFTRAMLNQQMLKKYNAQLDSWYRKFAKQMQDGVLDDAEMNALRGEYQQIVDEAIAERDRIAKITGYDSSSMSQEASSAFTGMSQETADELNGRFTALQLAAEGIRGHVAGISQNIEAMMNLSLEGVGHLEDISRNTHQLYSINERLAKIEANTRNL